MEVPTTVRGAPLAASDRSAVATAREAGSAGCDVLVAEVATGGAIVDGLPVGLTAVGAIGIRVDEATSAAMGTAVGRDGLCEPGPELGEGLGCLLRDGLGAGVADGAPDVEAEGAGVVAVGDAEGAGVVAVGAGVGVADGDGSAAESVGDGLGAADDAADAAAAPAGSVWALGPDEVGATVAAAAIPVPHRQMTAVAAPAVITPRRNRLDIRPPCLDHRT